MNKYFKYKNKYLSLKKFKGGSLQDLPFQYEQCVICLEEIKQNDSIRTCYMANHMFHTNCINQHLQTRHYCPLCNNIQFIDPIVRARAQELAQEQRREQAEVENRQREAENRQREAAAEERERQREIGNIQRFVQDDIYYLVQSRRMSRIEAINNLIIETERRAQTQQNLWGNVQRQTVLELDELRRQLAAENQI